MLADGATEHVADFGQGGVEVDVLRLDGVSAGEGQQLSGQVGGPVRGRAYLPQLGLYLGLVGAFLDGEVGVVRDDREDVVEVVVDSAG